MNYYIKHSKTFPLRKNLQNLEFSFKDHEFSDEDQILIIDFLTRLVQEEETPEISEGQLMVLLPHLLNGSAGDQ